MDYKITHFYMIVYYAQPVYIYYKFVHILHVDSPFLPMLQSVIFFAEPVEVTAFPDGLLPVGNALW